MSLGQQDLNLLVVLQTLLEQRSVTRAARILALSPSATSHALARLREAFDDPLLVRDGNRMVSTPRADALAPELERVLEDAQRLYRERPGFDPKQAERAFTIAASDLLAPLVPELVARLSGEAPRLQLSLEREVSAANAQPFESGEIDLGLQALPPPSTGLERRPLGRAAFVVVARRGHPFVRRRSLERWLDTPQVAIATGRPGRGFIGDALARAGHERRIALRVPSFLLALHTLRESDLLFTAPAPFVKPLASQLGLVTAPLPLDVPDVTIAAVWHERFTSDPGHRWFRERVCAVVEGRLGCS